MEIGVKFRGALFSTTLALLLITPIPAVYAYSEAPAAKFENTAIAGGGTIWYVDHDATGSSNGTSWANAFNYLQDALASSQQGDDIWVAEGTYTPDQGVGKTHLDQTATFALINGVGIYGGFAGGETSLDKRDWHNHKSIMSGDLGDEYYSYHVVTGSETDETAIIDGFTIKSGDAIGLDGGGMYNNSGSPTVTNCTFSGNRAGNYGGGMYNTSSSPTLTNCIFSGNSADSNGGGICNFQSSPTVTNCIFSGNSADTGGGMVNVTSSSPSVSNCIFSGNSAELGGGMVNFNNSSPSLINCIFSGNSANSYSGGMHNDKSSPTMTNCTFSGNSADIGGGMANFNSSSLTVTNCIIWGNSAPNGPQLALDNSSLTISYSDLEGDQTEVPITNGGILNWVIGNINLNPDFQDADGSDNTQGTADDNLRLSTISPCIDAGYNAALPPTVSTDLDGYQRIVDGNNDGTATVDMGAYEQPANLTTEEQIQLVVDTVDQLLSTGVVNKGQGNALKSKLSAAISSLEKGHIKPAINQLQAFINQVDAYESADILTEDQADLLREAVQNILSSL